MAENTYTVGYSTNARAKCKYSGCSETIEKDELRFTKSAASAFSERPKCEYYHAKCMFLSFVRARKTTKKIESMSDIEGVESLKTADKDTIKKLLKEWKSGNMKDQVPKITRKRKADSDQSDDKKKKKKTVKSKKKSRKTQDSDDEEDTIKPHKSRKATKSSDDDSKRSSSSKKQDSDEDEDDDNFNRILKGRSSSSNIKKVSESESEDKSEEEKPKQKAKPKAKAKTSPKKTKSDESEEEVKESASSDEENDKFLSGKTIALCGKLSLPREKVIELIEKNGGKYAKGITKDVTHVICAKTDDKTQKLQKAKEAGKILVTESFLKKESNCS